MTEKIALVTGANGGLGNYVTKELLDANFTVAGVSPHIRQSDFNHPSFIAFPATVNSLDEARNVVAAIVARCGTIDVLAHLVGDFTGGQAVADTDDATWRQMFDANLNAAFHILRAVIPVMRKAAMGRIIAIASRQAEEPAPAIGAYSASKAALVSLIKTVALENKSAGITANVILPATMDTPGNRKDMPDADISQWVQPSSVASLIVWLAGDAGRDINGAAIPVYGRAL